jgi:hypothetical protein
MIYQEPSRIEKITARPQIHQSGVIGILLARILQRAGSFAFRRGDFAKGSVIVALGDVALRIAQLTDAA